MRSLLLDNAKGLLIVLVIFGHLLESVITAYPISRAVYVAIYYFHIPAFALLSGAVSKRATSSREWWDRNRELFTTFVVFDVLYELFHFFSRGAPSEYVTSAQPYWLLWYLWSLVLWRLLLVHVSGTPSTIAVAVLTGCLIGCLNFDSLPFGLSRTVVFLPFFFGGYYLRSTILKFEPRVLLRMISAVLLTASFPLALLTMTMNVEWLYGNHSYSILGVPWIEGVGVRGLIYLISASLCFSLLALLPRTSTPLGTIAANSLYVFVWHGFLIKLISMSPIPQQLAGQSEVTFILAALGLALISAKVLSLESVARATRNVCGERKS